MEKHYRFGSLELTFDLPDDRMYLNDRWLAPFAVPAVEDPHRFCFSMVEELTAPGSACVIARPDQRLYREGDWEVRYLGSVGNSWRDGYLRVASCGRDHRVELKQSQCIGRIGIHTVLSAIGIEHLMAQAGGLVFHCSFIESDGRAILFTAPSETGKSTQAELWRRHRGARIINGDRAAIRWDGRQLLAEGIPFCGSSEHCEDASLPIGAIVYLAKAPQTSIRRMGGYEAFSRIWEGVCVNTWDREDMERVSDLVQKLATFVPVYYLPCTPDESAVTALEQVLESR